MLNEKQVNLVESSANKKSPFSRRLPDANSYVQGAGLRLYLFSIKHQPPSDFISCIDKSWVISKKHKRITKIIQNFVWNSFKDFHGINNSFHH